MLKSFGFAALLVGGAVAATAAVNTAVILTEERMAHEEEGRILLRPIAGVENHFWYDYRANVNEAQKELSTDLRKAGDTEDLRDAWDEYRGELSHERSHYVKVMAKRGYREPSVTLID
ncbi:MAG: hypothetical protein J7494_06290 [Sphingobium sp.]|nr:hypothetical protein [Sphingobium sp.]